MNQSGAESDRQNMGEDSRDSEDHENHNSFERDGNGNHTSSDDREEELVREDNREGGPRNGTSRKDASEPEITAQDSSDKESSQRDVGDGQEAKKGQGWNSRDHEATSDAPRIAEYGPFRNGNGMRDMGQLNWSFNVNGFIWSEGEKYDVKDWRVVLDWDTDIMSRVDWELGTVGVIDSNVERMRGVSYEASDTEVHTGLNTKHHWSSDWRRRRLRKAVEDAEASPTMNAITSSMLLKLLERESILSLKDNLSKCGKLEWRPVLDTCRHTFQYARDYPRGNEVYNTSNLIRAFDNIVNKAAFTSCGSNVAVKGLLQDFCGKHIMLLTAIKDDSVIYLLIESTLQAQTKQGNDVIAMV